MSFADAIKGLIFKKPAGDDLDPRRGSEPIAGGRRAGESDNPYLSARRTWNAHIDSQVASRRMWQVVAILALLVVLAAVASIAHIGSQSKFIPYVIEVDKHGRAVAIGPVTAAPKTDLRVVSAAVSDFIANSRLVTPDVALQRDAIFRVYAMLAANDAATTKMNEWLHGAPPLKRAEKEMVSIDIKSVLPQSADTWQVEWEETTRDRQGVLQGKPVPWRALVTVYVAEPTESTKEKQLRMNPMSIFVRDFSWSRVL